VGALSARFFAYVQGADFYRALFHDALALAPGPDSRTLLDVGCGPGALTRLAAARGYQAMGIDRDAAMVAHAWRLAERERSTAKFAQRDLQDVADQADVVVAASLLASVDDPSLALDRLWRTVAPGGSLLVIEATAAMTSAHARTLLAAGVPGRRRHLLAMWAHARQGRTINPALLDKVPVVAHRDDRHLLDGMLIATRLDKHRAARLPPRR
jgi:trans-aconitate methyltransferase